MVVNGDGRPRLFRFGTDPVSRFFFSFSRLLKQIQNMPHVCRIYTSIPSLRFSNTRSPLKNLLLTQENVINNPARLSRIFVFFHSYTLLTLESMNSLDEYYGRHFACWLILLFLSLKLNPF